MARIVVAGGTGYAGSAILREAAGRGHEVTAISRSAPAAPVEGVRYVQGSVLDVAPQVVPGHDVVVAALSPRGDTAGTLPTAYASLAELAVATGARLVVVGGFSSLRPAPGAPRFAEGDIDPRFADEARELDSILSWLQSSAPEGLDWLFVSPAMLFGAMAPGERTGSYRIADDDVAQLDESGVSTLSGADFAQAVVDEIEQHQRTGHIGVVS